MKRTEIKHNIMKYAKMYATHSGHRRVLSVFLCLVMLVSSVNIGPAMANTGADSHSVTIVYEGEETDKVTLPEDEKAELTAVCTPASDDAAYQWQILADPENETWVNIYDGTAQQLTLSYALVKTLLDVSGSAYVRCRVTLDGYEGVSSPVCVTIEYMPPFDDSEVVRQGAETPQAKKSVRRAANQADDEDDGVMQLVSVTINYLDGVSGLPIYSSYTGSVNVSVEAYTATVISPTYLGYAPYYDQNEPAKTLPEEEGDADYSGLFPNEASVIQLNIPKGYDEAQYVINVYYFAIDVPFAVRYYFQNIHDDLYTEDVSLYQTGTAKTGTIITSEQLAGFLDESVTVGFTKLYHHPESVAADGSTVFECYYDRNYTMLKFDCNGGYGTEPLYARYGTPFLVNEPTRHGYVFAGWDKQDEDGQYDGRKDEIPSTIPAKSCAYKAIWTQANTTYHIAYWLQNADDDGYNYIGTVKRAALSGGWVTAGNAPLLTEENLYICGDEDEIDHTHDDAVCKPQNADRYILDTEKNKDITALVKGDGSTVLNVYYTRKYYTLRFIYAKETGGNYSVVGGSTYGFGNKGIDPDWFNRNYTLDELLAHVTNFDGDEKWGAVTALPALKTTKNAAYVTGTYPAEGEGEDGGNYNQSGERYHYIEITARYGADLTTLWPVDAFEKVKVKDPETHTANGASGALADDGWGNYAYLAGWNGEYKVQYTVSNKNSTVKGLYQKLDNNLLLGAAYSYDDPNDGVTRRVYTTATGSGKTVRSNVCYFLGFFDNGANIKWSIPREWIYESYVPVFDDEVPVDSDLYKAIMNAASPQNTADRARTYTDPNTENVYYYYKNNNQIYRLYDYVSTSDDNEIKDANSPNGQTQTALTGFEFETEGRRYEQFKNAALTTDGRESFTSRFFYKRDNFTLALHSHGSVFKSESQEFDSLMDDFMAENGKLIEPPYPTTLEEGAYYFDGWYASPECIEGTHYELGHEYRMPATNVALYAKWAPATHTVRFFRTYEDMLRYKAEGDASGLIAEEKVEHGLVLGSVDNPEDANYIFGGWFYENTGKRLAYTPLDIPVVRDMDVFATWGSQEKQPYRLHYALDEPETDATWKDLLAAVSDAPEDNVAYTVTNGAETRTYIFLASDGKFHLSIADDAEGFAFQGSTRTFNPKVGSPFSQLYDRYNKGYYPTIASHSLTIQYEEEESDPRHNVYTFTYVNKEEVDYRVEYRRADTGELITSAPHGGQVWKTTKDAVVTERFAVVENYIPDAFFKRLILAIEKDEDGNYVSAASNVIVFYYSPNTTSAYYAVHYMLQNLGADEAYARDENGEFINYTESPAHTEGIGSVGQECYIPPQAFGGFDVQNTAMVSSTDGMTKTAMTADSSGRSSFKITVSANGTELYIFYTRRQQEYRVYHLRYGTDIRNLQSLKYTDGTNGVLRTVETNQAQFGATVTASAERVSIGGMTCISAITQSILIRSRNEQNYIIFYYTPTQTTIEYKVWAYGGGTLDNTLEVFNGESAEIRGSKPTATDGYSFEGWYLDEACTQPVTGSNKGAVGQDNRLMPYTNNLDTMPKVNVFYAKFLPDNGSLTIVRKNGENDESNGKQVFVYKIQAVSDPDYVLYVTIVGDGSVTIKDLPCRKYTVEQQNGWSWRYENEKRDVTVVKDGISVTFGEAAADNKQNWLNGNSERITNRKG